MTFLKKSTSKLKSLSDKFSKPVETEQPPESRANNSLPAKEAASSSSAQNSGAQNSGSGSGSKASSSSLLQDAWDKLEGESKISARAPISTNDTPALNTALDTTLEDLAKQEDGNFIAQKVQNYEAPSFQASLNSFDTSEDVTPQAARSDMSDQTLEDQAQEDPTQDGGFNVGLQPVIPRPARADIGSMRLDVARISADIQSGEELYRRAQQRIESLTSFVENADIDFSLLDRLEPENRRLKARNRTLESELDDKTRKLSILTVSLEDHRKRLEERNSSFEKTQSKLSVATKSLQTYERTLGTVQKKLDKSDLSQERAMTALQVERRENEILRGRLTDMSTEIDQKNLAYIESKKIADSLAQDCSDFRQTSDTTYKANIDLRNALDAAQKQNNAMKGEMISLHEDIRNFKTQYEFNIISREDELTALQNQGATLKKQLEVKDEIVRNAARDVTELRKVRTAQDLERERLETQIQTQAFQLDELNAELLAAKQNATDFDRRYRDVATALSVTQARRSSSTPVETPDIQPVSQADMPDPSRLAPPLAAIPSENDTNETPLKKKAVASKDTSPKPDLNTDLSDEDLDDDMIMERITEFKLGLRKNII